MSWLLLATPIVGTLLIIVGVLALRYFLPVDRSAPSSSEAASFIAERVGLTISKFVGAVLRDERRRAVETMFEHQTANELSEILKKRA